jgi:uncharacterized protein YndB with AHSA1/START domain
VGGVLVLGVLLALIGFLLPAGFKVQRSMDISAPADTVYTLLATPTEWKRWSVWTQRDPAMAIEYAGAASGAGATWSWRSKTEGNGTMTFVEADAGRRLTYRLAFPDFGMQSSGLLLVEPAGSAVRVTWTNEGSMGNNPLNRWFGLFMDRLVGPDFEAGLANLKKLAESGR